MPSSTLSREHLLETCFCDMPSQVGALTLRPLSPGSFTLLGRLGNQMMVGASESPTGQAEMLSSVIQYIWVHSAPISSVAAIATPADLPAQEIAELGLTITFGQALAFLERYKDCALRMQASLAEVQDDTAPGKPAPEVLALLGSPPSSSPLEQPATPSASNTSFGSSPSSGPSPTSSPQTSQMEPPVDGPVPSTPPPLFLMPEPSSLPSSSNGEPSSPPPQIP